MKSTFHTYKVKFTKCYNFKKMRNTKTRFSQKRTCVTRNSSSGCQYELERRTFALIGTVEQ